MNLISAKKSPTRAVTPPPPAPRRRLKLTEKQDDDILVENTVSAPATQENKVVEPMESPPIPAAPVRAIKKTPTVTQTAPSPKPQVPLRSPVKPLISSDSDSPTQQDEADMSQSIQE